MENSEPNKETDLSQPTINNNSNNIRKGKSSTKKIITLCSLLALLFVIGIIPRINNWQRLDADASAEDPIKVNTTTLHADKEPQILILPSSIQAFNITPIWARTNGYLTTFNADIGDRVKEGQLLAVIDTPEVEEQLAQAQGDLANSQARLKIAQISAQRWHQLYQKNPEAVPQQEVDERDATLKSAVADVDANQANVLRLQKTLNFNRIIAPFDGTIIERDIDIGSLITAGSNGNLQQLFRIAKTDIVRVFVNVPQYYFRMIKDGMTTDVLINEFPNETFKGTIARNARALDPIARTMLTEIHVENKDQRLLPGLYATVKFVFHPDTVYFIIPTSAIIILEGVPYIAILDNENTVRLQHITIGRDFGKTLEISGPLKDGERIVTNPTDRVRNNAKVEVLNKD